MDLSQAGALLATGVAAGTVNAVAGGGSLITFPGLIAIGLHPIAANVSNSVAVSPGYLASVAGSRRDLPDRRALAKLIPTAVLGAAAGCAILLATPPETFELVVPFLVLAATAVLAFQDKVRHVVGQPTGRGGRGRNLRLQVTVALGSVYGGYFGAALGVMLVAGLSLVLDETLARVSAIKNLLSAVVGLTTVAVFAAFGPVNWAAAAVVAPATIVGGYVGAKLLGWLAPAVLKKVILVIGTAVSLFLIYRAFR
jgi:uncharacterized membrane protein YfcA